MNDSYFNELTDFQDDTRTEEELVRPSIEDKPDSSVSDLFCRKPGCEHLRFTSEVQHRNHILTHISLPSVIVPRLDTASVQKSISQIPVEKLESLKVRLKLTSSFGSDKPEFEDILASGQKRISKESAEQISVLKFYNLLYQSDTQFVEVVRKEKKVLSGPGGFFCPNGREEEVKPEFLENSSFSEQEWSSARRPDALIELDEPTGSADSEKRGDSIDNPEQEEEDQFQDGDNPENDFEDEEEEEEEEDNEEDEDTGGGEDTSKVPSTAPPSPTPSEVLRPHGFLAEHQEVDDDSCYPRSPVSPTRMVEMNGSTSAVSGSDNDSGHSRSPAPFTGGSGAGSGGEEDSSAQQAFWDDLVESSTAHNSDEATTNENGQTDENTAGNVSDVTSDLDTSSVAANILENDPLLLTESASSAEGEQDNLNLLQNLTSDPLHTDVDRGATGETEYMSLDRLGEASFCCEVCGERSQDRRFLEEHRAMAGHYKCLILPECSSIVWSTAAELAAHQSSIHGVQPQPSQSSPQPAVSPMVSTPTTSPHTPGTPPVQQLAQQVQRLPIPQQPPYPPMQGGQYPPGPQQQMPPQMGHPPMMPQMMPGPMQGPMPGQMPGQMPGPMPQRRPPGPPGYRMPMTGQSPFGPGSPNQQQPSFSGSIQPRPLNTMVAPQQARPPMPQGRMPPAGAVMGGRGMVSMSMRGQKRPGPVPQGGRGAPLPQAKQRRVEGMMPPQQDNGKKSDASAVANILATRGITVTPAGAGGPQAGRGAGVQSQVRQRQNMMAPAPPAPVTTLNLNSAISIIPTTGAGNGRQQNNSGFAVPQVRAPGRQPVTNSNVDRPPRPPTVDLTGDGPVPPPGSTRLQMGPTFHRGRGRPSNLSRTTCQICDKVFASHEMLQQHMVMHRGPGKLPFRCNLCNAQYPTNQGLQQHRLTYHKETVGMSAPLAPGEEMVIPLIDLKQPGVAARLSSLGIHHCIPLSGLGNQSNGYFSLPVVSIDGSRPGAAGNLRSLGASGVLSIGPIKLVPK